MTGSRTKQTFSSTEPIRIVLLSVLDVDETGQALRVISQAAVCWGRLFEEMCLK